MRVERGCQQINSAVIGYTKAKMCIYYNLMQVMSQQLMKRSSSMQVSAVCLLCALHVCLRCLCVCVSASCLCAIPVCLCVRAREVCTRMCVRAGAVSAV